MGLSNQGELDGKALRQISENAEVEHALLSPFRWLIRAGKIIIYILLAISWLLFTLVGWVFNVGEYSMENRREAVCDARAYFQVCNPYEFNSTHHPADFVWVTSRISPDNSSVVKWIGGDPKTEFAPDQYNPGEMNPTPKPWINFGDGDFFLRSDDVFRQKSAQMDRVIGNAAVSLDTLRYVIATANNIDKDQVILNTPNLVLRWGVLPGTQAGLSNDYYVVYGMCLQNECTPDGSDLNYYLTRWDVLFKHPALSPHQKHAVAVLQQMDTLGFWLKEAQANGVHDDRMIRSRFEEEQSVLQRMNKGGP